MFGFVSGAMFDVSLGTTFGFFSGATFSVSLVTTFGFVSGTTSVSSPDRRLFLVQKV